jgi:uncharacterized integral membrane protein
LRNWLTAAAALAATVFLIVAGLRNAKPVEHVDWIFGSADAVPLWCALGTSILVGGALAALALSVPVVRLRLRVRRAERRIAQLEREVHGLRTLPLDEEIRDVSREG